MAVSWGGHESLVIPKCVGIRDSEFDADNAEHRFVRMYVGLEDSQYIIEDLARALNK